MAQTGGRARPGSRGAGSRGAGLAAAQASSVNLSNWDTACAIDMTTLNSAIVAQARTPQGFAQSNAFTGSISGTWGPWQVFPDSGANGGVVRMRCPVATGTGTDITGASYRLDGAVGFITVRLTGVPTPAVAVTDRTALPGTGTITSLVIETQGTPSQPPVEVNNMTPPAINAQFGDLFADWFSAHIHEFDALFHTAILNVQVDKATSGNMQWVKPQFLRYASLTNTANVGIFGALCKTTAGPYGKLAEQLPPGLLDNMPAGCNSVFAISGEKFAERFLLQGALQCIPGAKESDFEFVNDGLGVRNVNPLNWVPIDFAGSVVTPVIPVGGVTIKVSQDQIRLDFTGLTWDHKLVLGLMGSDVFSLDFSQSVYLALRRNAAGEPVFVTSNNPAGAPSTARELPQIFNGKITVIPDATAVTAQRVLSIISMICAVLGGAVALLKVFRTINGVATSISDCASTVAKMLNEGESIFDLMIEADSINQAATDAEVAAGNSEGLAAAAGNSASISSRALTYFARFAMLGGMVGLAGMGLGYWQKSQIGKDNDIVADSMPTITGFLDNVLGCAHWPTLTTWKLQEAQLAESLLLYGTLSS